MFDPRKLPEDVALLHQYGNDELEKLLRHYGSHQSDLFEGTVVDQEPDVDDVVAREEWGSFKNIIHLKRQEYRKQYNIRISKARSEEERDTLSKAKEKYGPHQIWTSIKADSLCEEIFPECCKLLY